MSADRPLAGLNPLSTDRGTTSTRREATCYTHRPSKAANKCGLGDEDESVSRCVRPRIRPQHAEATRVARSDAETGRVLLRARSYGEDGDRDDHHGWGWRLHDVRQRLSRLPMPQALTASPDQSRVTISCMVSDLRFEWRPGPVDRGTRISVHVEIPEREAARLDMQRDVIESSLRKLAELATQRLTTTLATKGAVVAVEFSSLRCGPTVLPIA